jgi:hypothetical protein
VNYDTDARRDCAQFEDDLAAVALETASGRRREEVLAHVANCSFCTAELAQYSSVADAILQLAPEAEPPLGFELRLARRLESSRSGRTTTRRRRVGVLALAALVIVVLGVGVGLLIPAGGPGPQSSATTRPIEVNLRSHGQVVGNVILSSGATPWMIMTIERGWWSGAVTCQAILAGGTIETIGTFRLSGDYGSWGAPLSAPVGSVRGARLVAANGVVLASATLRS